MRILEPETLVDDVADDGVDRGYRSTGRWRRVRLAAGIGTVRRAVDVEMGNATMHAVAKKVRDKLHERGLATESADGISAPIHPHVRLAYLLVLAQLARETGTRHGLDPASGDQLAEAPFEHLAVSALTSRDFGV